MIKVLWVDPKIMKKLSKRSHISHVEYVFLYKVLEKVNIMWKKNKLKEQ